MERRERVRRQRRVLAAALGISAAAHAVLLAYGRLTVLPPAEGERRPASTSLRNDRFLRARPLRVVRLVSRAPRAEVVDPGGYPARSAARLPARADAVPAARPNLSAAALDLRPVEGTSGGLETVLLTTPRGESSPGSHADLNEGVVFEAASRAAREAAKKRGRDRRGPGGVGVGIHTGMGGGSCPGGAATPTAIIEDFTGLTERIGGPGGIGRRGGGLPRRLRVPGRRY